MDDFLNQFVDSFEANRKDEPVVNVDLLGDDGDTVIDDREIA